MEEGEGRKADVKEMSDWEYLSIVAARRAAAYRFTRNSEGPVDLSTYVDRADYPIDADIEYELHWNKRGRLVPKVPKWAQEEYASRAITPANGRKQDHPNSASQATTSASSGIKALKRPLVEDPSATDPCADAEAEAFTRKCERYPAEVGLFQEGDLVVERVKKSIITPALPPPPPVLKSRVIFPKRP